MISWIRVALALLQIADKIISFVRERKLIEAGVEQEIARASAAILVKTAAAKKTMEEVSALNEKQVDDLLRSLEPK